MKKVSLFLFRHKNRDQIGIEFKFDLQIKESLKGVREVLWTKTHSCFYIPCNRQSLKEFCSYMQKRHIGTDESLLDFSVIPEDKTLESNNQHLLLYL